MSLRAAVVPRRYRILVPLLWTAAAVLGIAAGRWEAATLALVIHVIEVPLAGLPRGVAAGYARGHAILMTMVFGFTWWKFLPGGQAESPGAEHSSRTRRNPLTGRSGSDPRSPRSDDG